MAGKLYGLNALGLAHTYDSGGQLQAPGVMIGNETMNVGLAPDNDPRDLGVDLYANVANGSGPQYNGDGLGANFDLDTNQAHPGTFVAGVDDGDSGNDSDLAAHGNPGQMPDDGYLAVHLSGVGDHAVDGAGEPAQNPPSPDTGTVPVGDVPALDNAPSPQTVSHTAFGLGVLGFDHA